MKKVTNLPMDMDGLHVEYNRFGILVCCAGAGAMRVDRVKKLIDLMEIMGYDLLELCLDDRYKIDEEPFFGYLRGGYTKEEIKDMDAYAKAHSVELVPSIQTLAHFDCIVKLPHFADIVDVSNILLVDEPKTYVLIENMFKSLRESFTTNLVNIGFDEAHQVGLGKYLDKHGYTNRYELLLRHLNRVIEIAAKYGFKIHMWSDMFFRLANKGRYYGENIEIPQDVIDKVPETAELCYWDYGEHAIKEEIYDAMFTAHEKFNSALWFAGGVWNWNGFAPQNTLAQYAMLPAFKQARKHGVKNVLVTIWGDDGNDTSYFVALPSLYALRQYALGNFDQESIERGFFETFGVRFDDFMLLDIPNLNSGNADLRRRECAAKSLLYNDCFLGWKDRALSELEIIPYGEYAEKLWAAGKRAGEYQYIFDCMAELCYALDKKASLGIRTREAYQKGDKAELTRLLGDYEEAAKRIDKFGKAFRKLWLKEYRPYGWEIQQLRFGGLHARVLDCKERLEEYLNGDVERIPELEEEILPYGDIGLQHNAYRGLISVN